MSSADGLMSLLYGSVRGYVAVTLVGGGAQGRVNESFKIIARTRSTENFDFTYLWAINISAIEIQRRNYHLHCLGVLSLSHAHTHRHTHKYN